MAEDATDQAETGAEVEPPEQLDERRLEQLTDLVYKLLREELIVTRERRGEPWNRGWR